MRVIDRLGAHLTVTDSIVVQAVSMVLTTPPAPPDGWAVTVCGTAAGDWAAAAWSRRNELTEASHAHRIYDTVAISLCPWTAAHTNAQKLMQNANTSFLTFC